MIHNIFSKSKKEENSNLTIQVDYREKNSLVPAQLKSLNYKIELKELKVGDYKINDTIIERKEIHDLVQSIKNKRIFKQLKEMKQYPHQILIIEGNIYSQKSFHPNAIKGFILSVLIDQKISIIQTNSSQETAKYLSILANKKQSNFKMQITKKELSFFERQNFILQAFQNIGPKTSKKLLEEFKSLKNIFNSPIEKLKPILKKKTINFLKQLN